MICACGSEILSTSDPLIQPTKTGLAPTSTINPISEIRLFLSPNVPVNLKERMEIPPEVQTVTEVNGANVIFDKCAQQKIVTKWFYLEVEPFTRIVTTPRKVVMSKETFQLFGDTYSDYRIETVSDDLIYDAVLADEESIALIPFEKMGLNWRVLQAIPGRSIDFCISGDQRLIDALMSDQNISIPASNFDPEKKTTLAMTGVTALVRQTGEKMDQHGVLYPAEKIGEVLSGADITHISNEVSFSPDCLITWNGTRFCSKPEYFDLLKEIGTDIVELTGNHLMDYGNEPLLYTLNLYDTSGISYYGGGKNLEEAATPLLIDHHGNRLAFIGCNRVGPDFDWATVESPGSNPCDIDHLQEQIQELDQQGFLTIITFQHLENCDFEPLPPQRGDFFRAAEAGAVIVSGSQAHCPQTMEFKGGTFIHYGLGNLFFDQTDLIQRIGFIDEYTFYENQLIAIDLIPYIIEDQAQPRLLTRDEKNDFLIQIFKASGW